ncbi:two-component system sensor histidine kinase NtrB [Pedomonas mirosovicensis]|uniref:two-component system sensor histidine kinase NtrB n=1 Tax=Pedomonas mirosovicensis TaxID=2908641 RepID=UPI002167681F|nr:ATP-binding protein [Pedomonas mirosovicensis]MCH8685255.1 ATP-binding protein [Pedomonas mirosovicensis]
MIERVPVIAAARRRQPRTPSAALLLDIVNTLPGPVLCFDENGVVRFANTAAEDFFNMSALMLEERGLTHVLPADSSLLALLEEARQQQSSFAGHAVELAFIGGGQVVADISVTPLAEQPGWLLLMLQSRSITQLIDRHLTHQGAARSVVGVAAMLAHEIKNPLSGIRGAAQLLEDGADEGSQELTRLICAEVDRIRALVDRMEGFTDTRPMERQPENIHQILGHVRRIAENGFAKNLTIRERYDPSLPPVLANRDRLVQVFLNLVKNAAEAAGEGGEIQLTTAYRHGVKMALRGAKSRISLPLEICVIDSGPGAPPELADHMFEPFVSTKPNGSGLGLALVAKVIGDHGGVIEYERQAEPPRTIFRILLPLASDVA